MLVGQLPFGGDSAVEIALRHIHDQPPPLPADVPPAVRAVVERALAKDPAMRWPSGAVLAQEARRASIGQEPGRYPTEAPTTRPQAVVPVRTQTVPPPGEPPAAGSRKSRRRLVTALVVGLAVAVIATVGVLLNQPDHPQLQTLAESPVASAQSPADTPQPSMSEIGPTATSGATSPGPVPSATGPKPSVAPGLVAPAGLTATPINASTIRLRWNDNSSDETGFTVINGSTSHNVGADTTTYDWTGLAPGTYMCFKVRAYNATGVSVYDPPITAEWACVTTPTT